MGDWKRSFSTLHHDLGVRRDDLYGRIGDDLRWLWNITPGMEGDSGETRQRATAGLEVLFSEFLASGYAKTAQKKEAALLSLRSSYNVLSVADFSDLGFGDKEIVRFCKGNYEGRRIQIAQWKVDQGGKGNADSTIREHLADFQQYAIPAIEKRLAELSSPLEGSALSAPEGAPIDASPDSDAGPDAPLVEQPPFTQQEPAGETIGSTTDAPHSEPTSDSTPAPFPFIQDTWSTHQDEILATRALSGGTRDGIRGIAVELFHDGHGIIGPDFDRYGVMGDDRLVLIINEAFVGGITRAKAREALLQLAAGGSNFIPSGRWDFILRGIQDLCRSRNPFAVGTSSRQFQRVSALTAEYQEVSRRCGRLDLGGDWLAPRIRERALEIGVALGMEVDHRRPPREIMSHLVTMDAIDRTNLESLYRSHPASLQQTARTLEWFLTGTKDMRERAAFVTLELCAGLHRGQITGLGQKIMSDWSRFHNFATWNFPWVIAEQLSKHLERSISPEELVSQSRARLT